VASTPRASARRGARARFSLGFNFDRRLIAGLARLNSQFSHGQLVEVFGALPEGPISSARPMARIRRIGWDEFTDQVRLLAKHGIAFNYLMNTSEQLDRELREGTTRYLRRLRDAGVSRFTMGTPELCWLAKEVLPSAHVTMSITRGTRSVKRVEEARDAGADACYLDGVFVNRNFALLRSLVAVPGIAPRLYANMSCISGCPVVRQHYRIFAGEQGPSTEARSHAYFTGCSLVKLRSPVEWIQMPWIRPEDIGVYMDEGVGLFKLSDRLAATDVLLGIARAYVSGESPPDLFELIERDGTKYHRLHGGVRSSKPLSIWSDRIPANFIDHFRSGECSSRDLDCPVCASVAYDAIERHPDWEDADADPTILQDVPAPLRARAEAVAARGG
jgi:hypothetical protein